MYQALVFIHLVGVFGFLAAHGVSMGVLFRLRKERDPSRITGLLQLSGVATQAFYTSLVILLAGGVIAAFDGHLWAQGGWLWGAIAVLVVTTLAMYQMASPYYRRLRVVAGAMAGGSKAVTDEQLDEILTSGRPVAIAVIGVVGLLAILYFMVFKPSLGLGSVAATAPPPSTAPSASGTSLSVTAAATGLAFQEKRLSAPAGRAFTIVFDNKTPGTPHNVAVYTNASASTVLFRGAIVTGPTVTTYHVKALAAGSYYFRCDVHPQMNGTFVVGGGS